MDTALLFEAGRVAAARGWARPTVVDVAQVGDLEPAGEPVIALASSAEISSDDTRSVATLVGAGRQVLLVVDSDVPAECAAWLPPGVLHLVGSPVIGGSAVKADGTSSGEIQPPALAPAGAENTHHDTTSSLGPTTRDHEFDRRCRIVADAWLAMRDKETWQPLVRFGDVGFPLAYAVSQGFAVASPQGAASIDEMYQLIVTKLGVLNHAHHATFAELLRDARVPLESELATPEAPAASQPAATPTCSNCGTEFVPGDAFCGSCGAAR